MVINDTVIIDSAAIPPPVPVEVRVAWWIWFAGSVIATVSALITVILVPEPLVITLVVGITAAEVIVAVPAAVMVVRGARWAQIALLVLAFLSLGSLYSWTDLQAWGSVIFNVILGSTGGLLTTRRARAFFAAHRRHAPGH
ncbi:hypothetical protein [Saccharopolyspora hattusasensis]|uniref:hypothetical protein n=1 Tax=Saccharopolyspora hattusasensis TaxID=1128679 RepID=UPI003D969385